MTGLEERSVKKDILFTQGNKINYIHFFKNNAVIITTHRHIMKTNIQRFEKLLNMYFTDASLKTDIRYCIKSKFTDKIKHKQNLVTN